MSRLIDADALMEDLKKWKGLNGNAIEAVIDTINNQPTVYDVEKVVEEMKREKKQEFYSGLCSYGFIHCMKAIDIVKRGGIE